METLLHIETFSVDEIYERLSTILDNFTMYYKYNVNRDNWYVTANKDIEKILGKYEIPVFQLCGVVSALSPQLKWSYNIISANYLIDHYLKDDIFTNLVRVRKNTRQSESNILKAIAILESESEYQVYDILHSPKTQNFFENLLTPNYSDAVTIDRHIIKASGLMLPSEKFVTDKQYNFLAGAIRLMSQELHILPCQVQSTIWENYREIHRVID